MKGDWKGLPDGTPCSEPEKNPADQDDCSNKGMDWRGQEDGSPSSNPSTDPTKGD